LAGSWLRLFSSSAPAPRWVRWLVAASSPQLTPLDDIAQRPWQDFERLMAEVFKLDGWAVSVVGTSARGRGDGGVDLILRRPGEAVAVQCKRVRGRVGVEKVRELQGALADFGALRGIFVTLGDFTQEAHDFATRRGWS